MIHMLNIKEAILELHNEKHLILKEDYDSLIQDAIDYINSDISIVPVEPIIVPPPTITLTVSDDILSYADNDSTVCTVTAVGETEGYSIKWYKNDSYLTTTTFSNNTASYTYNSQGEGNVTIRADLVKNNNVIDTDSILLEDCWNTKLTEFSVGSSMINSIGMDTVHNVQNDDFVLVFEHKGNGTLSIGATNQYSSSTANYRATLGSYDSKHYCAIRTTSTSEVSATSMDLNTYYTYKIERIGTTINFYVDGVLWQTKTTSFFSDYSAYSIYSVKWDGGNDYFKNIRLKSITSE